MKSEKIAIETEFIKLDNLLKLAGAAPTGGRSSCSFKTVRYGSMEKSAPRGAKRCAPATGLPTKISWRKLLQNEGRFLSFHHFRNLCDGELKASDGVNVIWGDNAQGKTNLLEAIWLFTGSRSFRGAKDAELLSFSKKDAALTLSFTAQDREQMAKLSIAPNKQLSLNGVSMGSASAMAGISAQWCSPRATCL